MIKKLLLFLTLFHTLHDNHIQWLGNYQKALQQAQKTQKNLMIFLINKDCPLCHDILKKTFMNQHIVDTLNQKFICVIVTFDSKESYPIEMYYTTTFPTLFFVDGTHERFLTAPLYAKAITIKAIEAYIDE